MYNITRFIQENDAIRNDSRLIHGFIELYSHFTGYRYSGCILRWIY